MYTLSRIKSDSSRCASANSMFPAPLVYNSLSLVMRRTFLFCFLLVSTFLFHYALSYS